MTPFIPSQRSASARPAPGLIDTRGAVTLLFSRSKLVEVSKFRRDYFLERPFDALQDLDSEAESGSDVQFTHFRNRGKGTIWHLMRVLSPPLCCDIRTSI